ncbi:hypothetical protein BHE90_016766 [Fusarium euwallaceae]|uniref:Uncharacterized protein n=1 Tax=Fusarium euwallaceae TaxID=1147111 RepID=A0A430KZI0_9HYPO|nr:hypothetical protein BHE90_016766 [Fusarium euwallaceae]
MPKTIILNRLSYISPRHRNNAEHPDAAIPTTRSSKPGGPDGSVASSKGPALKSTDSSPFDVVPPGETRPLRSAAPSTSLHPRGSYIDRSLRARQVLRFLHSEHRKNADASYQAISSVDPGFYRLKALANSSTEQDNEEEWPASWEPRSDKDGGSAPGVQDTQAHVPVASSSKKPTEDLEQQNEAQAIAPKGPSQPPVATKKTDKTNIDDSGNITTGNTPAPNTDTPAAMSRDSPVPTQAGSSIPRTLTARQPMVLTTGSVAQSSPAHSLRPASTPLINTPDNLIVQPDTENGSASVGVYCKGTPAHFAPMSTTTSPSNIVPHAAAVTHQASSVNTADTTTSVRPAPKTSPIPVQFGSPAAELVASTQLPAQASTDTQKTPTSVRPDSGLTSSTFETHASSPRASGTTTAAARPPSTTMNHHSVGIGHPTTKETGIPNSTPLTPTVLPKNSMIMDFASNPSILSRKNSAINLGTDQADNTNNTSRVWGMASIRDNMPDVGGLFSGETFSVFTSANDAGQPRTDTPSENPTSPSPQDSQNPASSGGMGLTEANLHEHDVISAQSSSYGSNPILPPMEWYEWYKEYHAGQRRHGP